MKRADTQQVTPFDAWRIWGRERAYGVLLYRRARGELPEMESAKALASLVKPLVESSDEILDVGCGCGHYYRTLRRVLTVPFSYMGVDSTSSYIRLAQKAWQSDTRATFKKADVYSLPFKDSTFDLTMACNVLLHLPTIDIPIAELVRVSRRYVVIRTLVGDRSFRIKEVYDPATHPDSFPADFNGTVFSEDGEPAFYHYYNIYSNKYIQRLLARLDAVRSFEIIPDTAFDHALLMKKSANSTAPDATKILGGWQVNGYILQPWHFIKIEKKGS